MKMAVTCCPTCGELTPAIVALAIASRIQSFLSRPPPWTQRIALDRSRKRLSLATPHGHHGGARTPFLQRLPPQHLNTGSRRQSCAWAVSAVTTWQPGCPIVATHDLYPDGRRGRDLDRSGAVHRHAAHVFQNLGDGTYFHSGILASARRRGFGCEYHLQDSLQRCGRHDRWPAH